MSNNSFDVIISGAGPAGCTTAIRLAPSGLRIALLDKGEIPAEKVCGDALSGTVINVIKRFPEPAFREFMEIPGLLPSWGIRFHAPSSEILDLPFVLNKTNNTPVPGVICKRIDLEAFLLKEIRKHANISLFPNHKIRKVQNDQPDRVTVSGDSFELTGKMIVGADGLNSIVAKQLAGIRPDPSGICIGTRGYYRGVTGFHPEKYIELLFLKELLPGYLWIFPMSDGHANVGLGMMPGQIKESGRSVSDNLSHLLSTHPLLKARFADATLTGEHQSHGLPIENLKSPISGHRFLLTGDAASLVDPFTGEGIGNAMVSGEIAAGIITEAFRKNDLSGEFLHQYDLLIDKKIRKELQLSRQIRKFASNAGLFNFAVKQVNKREKLRDLFCAMYTDLEMRKKLTSPGFYLKMVTNPRKMSSS